MKIVYLIGNGFDLNLGLRTSYSDFYRYYLNTISDDYHINQLKKHLEHDEDNEKKGRFQYWSDLEIAMGEYTKNFGSLEVMEKVYNDLNDNLRNYIQHIEQIGITNFSNKAKLIYDFAHPEKYLRDSLKEDFTSHIQKHANESFHTHVISFNYTKTIETILNIKGNISIGRNNTLYPIIHIHGLSDDPIIGLNNKEQIKNEFLRENEDVQDFLLKPNINKALGHLKDKEAINLIKSASVICLFGVSLGETDKIWWETVGERIKGDCRVFYFVHNPEEFVRAKLITRIRKKYKNFLLSKTKLNEDEWSNVYDKIYVVLNSDMFKLTE